jgi:hypothetical protein
MAFAPLFGYVLPETLEKDARELHEIFKASAQSFASAAPFLTDTGKGKVSLIWKAQEQIAPLSSIRQEIGDCVGFGYSRGDDLLSCVEIVLRREPESWKGYSSSEWIYGTSRVLVGGGRIRGDGSIGSWAAKAVSEHGTLLRAKYPQVDLSRYTGERAKLWGSSSGFPRELETLADEHPVKTTALVKTYEEARDMIANGYPVAVCSRQGFSDKRDAEGFARPQGVWPHCMLFIGGDDSFRRPGLLCDNRSWGDDWNGGPTRHDQPGGTFWVDANVVDKMLSEQDSYALADKTGYRVRVNDLDNRPW